MHTIPAQSRKKKLRQAAGLLFGKVATPSLAGFYVSILTNFLALNNTIALKPLPIFLNPAVYHLIAGAD
jgi:hypothetical protein